MTSEIYPSELAKALSEIVADETGCRDIWDIKISFENGVRKIEKRAVTLEEMARIKNRLQRVGA